MYQTEFKVLTNLGHFDPGTLRESVRHLHAKIQWKEIDTFQGFSLGEIPSTEIGGVMVCQGNTDHFENELDHFRESCGQIPLICLYDVDNEALVQQKMMGMLDRIVPLIPGWEEAFSYELSRWVNWSQEAGICPHPACQLNQETTLKSFDHLIIKRTLDKFQGKVYRAAKHLEIGKSTIYRMLQEEEISQ